MSHFSNIGFGLESGDELFGMVKKIVEEGESHKTSEGVCASWSPGVGAELWVNLNEKLRRFFVNPHFSGTGRMTVLVDRLEIAKENPMDGAVKAWASPEEADPALEKLGRYPFVFDPPAFELVEDKAQPKAIINVQIAAFAEQLVCYPDRAAFDQRQEDLLKKAPEGSRKLEPGYFIPTGLFAATDKHPAKARFSGTVLDTELLTNPHTGLQFYHLLIDLPGGTIDVVADPIVPATECTGGGIIEGEFWLSGQIVDEA